MLSNFRLCRSTRFLFLAGEKYFSPHQGDKNIFPELLHSKTQNDKD